MAPLRRVASYYRSASSRDHRAVLARESRACASFARKRGLVIVEPFVESARGLGRPELERALERCRASGAGLLVPSLAASGGDLRFLEPLIGSGVALFCVDQGRVRHPTLRLLLEVARHQQQRASDRSREALQAARRRGARLGSPRPEVGSRAGVAALRAGADAQAERVAPDLLELLLSNPGASLRDLAEGLDALGVETPRKGRWGPSAVRNALRRAGLEALWRSPAGRASQLT